VIIEAERQVRFVARAKGFVQLLARANSHDLDREAGRYRLGYIGHPYRRKPRHKYFAAMHAFQTAGNKIHALLQRDPESRHARIRNRQLRRSLQRELLEVRHDRSA